MKFAVVIRARWSSGYMFFSMRIFTATSSFGWEAIAWATAERAVTKVFDCAGVSLLRSPIISAVNRWVSGHT